MISMKNASKRRAIGLKLSLVIAAAVALGCGGSGSSPGGSQGVVSPPATPAPSNPQEPSGLPENPEGGYPRWSVLELTLVAKANLEDPYKNVSLTGTFQSPAGERIEVPGFWAGDREFRVRFTPTVEGVWTYTVTSTPADPGLTDGGSFSVGPPAAGSKGFLRRDPDHPHSFRYDDGARLFLWGQTYYEIVRNARAGGPWKAAVDGSKNKGMSKIRLLINPAWETGTRPYPRTSPFENDDRDRLDLEHWSALDEVVDYMSEKGMIADLILFLDHPRGFGTEPEDQRYVRYALARYAAYPNVTWCLTNEWNYTQKSAAYWNRIGTIVRTEDPWMEDGEKLRPLSIHQETRHDFQYFDTNWPVHAIVQVGVRNALHRNGDEWGNRSILRNHGRHMPVVNDEYGYMGEPDKSEPKSDGKWPGYSRTKHRQTIWGIAMAGGHGSAGDAHDYDDGIPFFVGNWHNRPEYDDIDQLVRFWTRRSIPYWRMDPKNELVEGRRAYARAVEGEEYVVYAAMGGTVKVDLASGRYMGILFNPRTGEEKALPRVTGGGKRNFNLPPGEDWVLHLRNEKS